MRPLFQLLPFQIEQAIAGRRLRTLQTLLARTRTRTRISPDAKARSRPRLYVDLAVISDHDAGTGIQRVVRELASALLGEDSAQWDVWFVSARRKKRYFRIAWPDRTIGIEPEEMRARPGDVFLGLDFSLDAVRRHRRQLARFRREGGSLWFLVHDLLPLNRPDWFARNTVIRYRAWLGILAGLADGFLCNSSQTETELKDVLAQSYGLTAGYRTQVLPMGHIIPCAEEDQSLQNATPRIKSDTPFTLMVGTLEPRKGHADVIAAFDALWREGNTHRLVLVGRMGWQVDALRALILAHPQYGARLLWFDDVADAELSRIYAACTGMIIASYGEGFGLPLIEALGHGKPVLARDLPVFRIHEGKGVHFFPADASPATLAQLAGPWLRAANQGSITVERPTGDWRDAARILLAATGPTLQS